jgi:hypothetical protein
MFAWQCAYKGAYESVDRLVKVALLEKTSSTTKLPQNLQSLAVQNLLKTFDEFDGGFTLL